MSWRWAAASCRGTSHWAQGTRCQDASTAALFGPDQDRLVLVASDGAGSAEFGGPGAWLTCRTFVQSAREHFATKAGNPTDADVADWIDALRDRIATAAQARDCPLRSFAATLVATVVSPDEILTAHIGDGAIVLATESEWQVASWPEQGEYASTTFFVTDDQGPRLRIERFKPARGIVLLTDGLERLVLDFGQRTAFQPFFERMYAPVAASQAIGRDRALSEALKGYLASDLVNARTDDDKTLLLAACG